MRPEERERRAWPAWLDPLRPGGSARLRMRAEILRRAEPLLAARRIRSWHEVAAAWSNMLIPIAAILLVFFAVLARQAASPEAAGPDAFVTLEELVHPADPEGTLGMLTSGPEPSVDGLLTLVIDYTSP